MPVFKRKKYVRKAMPKRRRIYRKKPMAKRRGLVTKKEVKSMIHRQISNKYIDNYQVSNTLKSVSTSFFQLPYIYNMMPAISPGTGEGQRIGEYVTPRYHSLRGQVIMLPNTGTSAFNPIAVRMFVGYKKTKAMPINTNPYTYDDFTDVFLLGHGSTTQFQANMLDYNLPINKDKWVVYEERKFVLGSNAGGYSGLSVANVQNVFKYVSFNVWKHVKTRLHFDSSNYVDNRAVQLFAWVVPLSGESGVNGVGTQTCSCNFHFNDKFTYEDA